MLRGLWDPRENIQLDMQIWGWNLAGIKNQCGPCWVAELIRTSSQHTKVAGSILNIQESTNKCTNKWNDKSMFLSLLKKNRKNKNEPV